MLLTTSTEGVVACISLLSVQHLADSWRVLICLAFGEVGMVTDQS